MIIAEWKYLFPSRTQKSSTLTPKIVISENITHIGDKTFYGCINVQKATIPNTVTAIGDNAFKNCDELTIYGEIGTYAQKYAVENEIPFVNTKMWDLNVDFIASSTKWYFDVTVEGFSGEALVYVATYDSDGRMLDLNSEDFVVNDITSLSLAKKSDASYAKAYISALEGLDTAKEAVKGLKSATGYIRREVGKRLHLRKTPELLFIADDSIEHGMNIVKIMDDLRTEEE